ncbi:MAG TPA: DUF2510 domain-containing protein [Acidimicrobiales bacterium]|nr:DUF2510 domain-containing protein [Acidimicrobiales bacterium]
MLALPPLAASAGPPQLSTVVVPDALPGMVVSPPGITNGPLNQANVNLFNAGPTETAAINQQLTNGDMSGYLRAWAQPTASGDGAVIIAFAFKDATRVAGFLGDFNSGVRESGASSFSVSQIPGASGFSDQISDSGALVAVDAVTFARGNIIFCVELVSPSADLASRDAIAFAARQAANAPGVAAGPVAPSASRVNASNRAGQIIGFVVGAAILIGLVALLVFLVRRRKRRFTIDTSYPGIVSHGFSPYNPPASYLPLASFAPPVSYQPPALTPMPIPSLAPDPLPGWYPDGGDHYQQRFWDGHRWTHCMRWNGSSWVDVPTMSPT